MWNIRNDEWSQAYRNVSVKDPLRKEIAKHTEEYLASGRRIQVCNEADFSPSSEFMSKLRRDLQNKLAKQTDSLDFEFDESVW